MLRFTVDGVKWEFDDDRLLNTEAIALRKVSGLTYGQLYDGIAEGDAAALTALVWLARRRAGETVKFSAVEFDLAELGLVALDENGEPVRPKRTPLSAEAVLEALADAGEDLNAAVTAVRALAEAALLPEQDEAGEADPTPPPSEPAGAS